MTTNNLKNNKSQKFVAHNKVTSFWYRPLSAFMRAVLSIFTWPYRLVIAIRRLFYKLGIFKVSKLACPIIVVGNITVGGSGKTPVIIALAEMLKNRGYKVGLISRGYGGGASTWPQDVQANSDPKLVGDEPVLLVQKTQCPMLVGPNRVAAAQELLKKHACDIILSDDGLQHLAMARDFEIAVISAKTRFGNGLCLPLGPLREPVSRLRKVDVCLCVGADDNHPASGNEIPVQRKSGLAYKLGNVNQKLDPKSTTKKIIVLTAIAQPDNFFASCRDAGFDIIEHAFPDHHQFEGQDFSGINSDQIILVTEKDAVKCASFSNLNIYVLPEVLVFDDSWSEKFLKITEDMLKKIENKL